MRTGLLEFGVEPVHVVVPPPLLAPLGRHRYAIGVFAHHIEVEPAVTTLCSLGCDVLIVSDPTRIKTTLTQAQEGRPRFHHIESSAASAFFAMLCEHANVVPSCYAGPPSAGESRHDARPGAQRLFNNMVHHLERGAVAVTVRASDAENQLQASRILLGARCAVLLTHDVAA